jgi:nucleoside-diphosphate-sugar epimerase
VLDDLSTGRAENLAGLDVEFVRGSIVDPGVTASACAGITGVFHEAAQVSVPRSIEAPRESYQVNVDGTLNVLEGCRRAGVKRLVFAASSAAYGDTLELPKVESMTPKPLSPYASGKLAGEDLLRVYGALHGVRGVALRYFNVFGPRQVDDSPYTGVIAIFTRALLEGRRPTIFGDGQHSRDLTYIDNVVAANLAAMQRDLEPGTVLNIGAGARVTILELYRAISEQVGSDLEPIFAPARAGDVRDSLAAIERARQLIGYAPTVGWREGIVRTVAWYRERSEAARV